MDAETSQRSRPRASMTHAEICKEFQPEARRILNEILETRTEDDVQIFQKFRKLPDRLAWPRYYKVITDPMSLDIIDERIQRAEYKNMEQLRKDLGLCVTNTKRWNCPETVIYKDALLLARTIRSLMKRKDEEEEDEAPERPYHPEDAVQAMCHDAMKRMEFVINNAIVDGRERAEMFRTLPSRRDYPDYYELIHQPLSFAGLFKKLRKPDVSSHEEIVALVRLMFNNALLYNAPGSEVYEDAEVLRDLILKELKNMPVQFKIVQAQEPKKVVEELPDHDFKMDLPKTDETLEYRTEIAQPLESSVFKSIEIHETKGGACMVLDTSSIRHHAVQVVKQSPAICLKIPHGRQDTLVSNHHGQIAYSARVEGYLVPLLPSNTIVSVSSRKEPGSRHKLFIQKR